jgi:hypothetical protein
VTPATARRAGAALAAVVALIGCGRDEPGAGGGPPIASCADSLAGLWQDERGRRWAVIDHGTRLEIYPGFADGDAPPGTPATVEVAPRAIDLTRVGTALTGVVRRRFMQNATACDATVLVRIDLCRGDAIELALPEPPVPSTFEPCTFPEVARPPRSRWTWRAPLR